MIPYFRSIRYRLAEGNQPNSLAGRIFKCISWAFGEIVLVATGILITIINNWNEELRKRGKFDQV